MHLGNPPGYKWLGLKASQDGDAESVTERRTRRKLQCLELTRRLLAEIGGSPKII